MAKIGFIGQGWIGKHYADDFEARLYDVVRYALEEPYVQNQEHIKECDIVFIAVPTPTTPDGFSYEPVKNALYNLRPGATAVIKSTLAPGTTEQLQEEFKDVYVMHSPEFLREASAAYDAANPDRNLVGIPKDTPQFLRKAQTVLNVLPQAPFSQIMSAREAEIVKYAGNCFLYTKVIFMNILYDLVEARGGDWERVREAIAQDPRIGESHTKPVHHSGHIREKTGVQRGAGGHCFIKDFEAFRQLAKDDLHTQSDVHDLLRSVVAYNNRLLKESNKDIDLLEGVYGKDLQVQH